MLGKKGKDKRFIKNWRPVSTLNTDMKIFFIFVKNNPEATGLNIFKHEFLCNDYADETTFFLKDRKSMIELMKNIFSNFLGFKPNNVKLRVSMFRMRFKWNSVA